MHKFIETFKTKAHAKAITCEDMIALCIFRTIKSKQAIDRKEILAYHLKKAFTAGGLRPDRRYPYQAIMNERVYMKTHNRRWDGTKFVEQPALLLGVLITDLFDEDEIAEYRVVLEMIDPDFVRNL